MSSALQCIACLLGIVTIACGLSMPLEEAFVFKETFLSMIVIDASYCLMRSYLTKPFCPVIMGL